MLRSSVIRSSKRLISTAAESQTAGKTWAKGSTAESLKTSKKYRESLLNGTDKRGPASLRTRRFKIRYNSPLGINEAFDAAHDILKGKAEEKYSQLEEVTRQLNETPESEELKALKNKLQLEAEIDNPEVRFNFAYNEKLENDPKFIDYEQPVYRELKRKHWENYGQMLLMQRLETLAVIPDTLPTLDPKVEVSLKFLNHTAVNRWVEPGSLLSSNVTTYAPSIKIQEYDNVDTSKQLYTVLIVNPDVPDIANNTYKTHLQWGLSNIKLTYNDNFINPKRLLEDTTINEIIDYLPPVPEKNLPKQRFSVWVFRQSKELNDKFTERDFNIREFTETNELSPVGAHVWRSAWDLNVPSVRELYGLPDGVVFHKVRGKEPLK